MSCDLGQFLLELLPHGRVEGTNFVVGNVEGEEGKSLKVKLTGENAGVWCDFSDTGRGDIFSLVMQVKKIGFRECLEYVKDYVGIKEPAAPDLIRTSTKVFTAPSLPSTSFQDDVMNYLHLRGIKANTAREFEVSSTHYTYPEGISMPSLVFPFKTCEGELALVKYLGISRPEGKRLISASPNSKPVLFGWQAFNRQARTLVCTKGELEAMSFHQLGFPTLAVPFGEGRGKHTWLEYEYENLAHFEQIIIHADDDKPGHASVQELAPKLGRHRCKFIYGSPIKGLKDVNDALIAGVTSEQVSKWLSTASSCDPVALKQATAFTEDVVNYFHDHSLKNKGYPLPIASLENSVRIRMGELSVWTGFSASGKSEFLGQTALHLCSLGAKVLFGSFEMAAPVVLGRLLRQHFKTELPSVSQIREGTEWMQDKVLFYDHVGNARLEGIIEVFSYAARKFGVGFFVLDSLMKCGVHPDDFKGQQEFVDVLQNFCREYQVHVALVAHSRKKSDDNDVVSRLDVKGSSVLGDLPELIIGMHRNRKKQRDIEIAMYSSDSSVQDYVERIMVSEPDAIVSVLKQRNGDGSEPKAKMFFDVNTKLFTEMP